MKKWITDFKEETEWEASDGEKFTDYEYSVVRENNENGIKSWGWGDENKIILFSSGIGGNDLNPVTEKQVNFAKRVATHLADVLNKESL